MGLAAGRTFNDIIDAYLNWDEKNHKPTSLEEIQRYCRLHIRRLFGDFHCSKLSRGVVQRIYDDMAFAEHFAAKIIDWSHTIWGWGDKRELVDDRRNPFKIEKRVTKSRRKRILSMDEYRRLWSVIHYHRYHGTISNMTLTCPRSSVQFEC